MSYEAWPSPDAPRGPLPRIDDLPIAEQGYDQEAVREAFDAFYRHAAQLDATLKALEAVEAFRRDAAELRADLRSLRALGYGGGGEPAWTSSAYTYERAPREFPAAALRVAAEAALIVAVAVAAGVGHFRAWVTVAVMAAAVVVVAVSEWLASRARYRVLDTRPLYEAEPEAPVVEAAELAPPELEVGWAAVDIAAEDEEEQAVADDELTAIGDALELDDEEEEPAEAEEPAEPEEQPETELRGSEPLTPEAQEPELEPEREPAPAQEPEPQREPEIPVSGSEPLSPDAQEPEQPQPETAVSGSEPLSRDGTELEPEQEPEAAAAEPAPKRRWFRRPAAPSPGPESEPPGAAAPPSHVRVLPATDPWERAFDGDEPDEDEPELAERGGLGKIRRRRR